MPEDYRLWISCSFGNPDRSMSHQVVTRWYRPPELLFGAKNYGGAVDLWSVGCIFAEMMLRVPYLQGDTDINQLTTIFAALGTPTEEDWPEMKYLPDYFTVAPRPPAVKRRFEDFPEDAVSLLCSMLRFDPNKRVTAVEALRDPYFSNAPAPTPQELLPFPLPKTEASLGSSERSASHFNGMGPPPRCYMAESPVPLLHFPTPDGALRLQPTPDGPGVPGITRWITRWTVHLRAK